MRSQNFEALSAMLDNEADELELRRIVKEAGQDPELAAAWERMSLVQAVLHDENLARNAGIEPRGNRLSEAVQAAIAAETPVAGRLPGVGQWGAAVAKLSIAASVALAFFLGMQVSLNDQPLAPVAPAVVQQQSDASPVTTVQELPAVPVPALAETASTEQLQRQVDPAARLRLEEYIRSASITREEPPGLEQLEDSPLYRLVNEIQRSQ